ncbi:tripartite motif-containing protein 14-like [Clupea harengus]|uniref:Tripartite motif-containing protein 14-like n=1 Tax=Clupea harengus TaxID=7950 RepID=A0A6P8GYH8_CLUHA|nr:tripartite motif-containing protein 14-like [Clupea harengus]
MDTVQKIMSCSDVCSRPNYLAYGWLVWFYKQQTYRCQWYTLSSFSRPYKNSSFCKPSYLSFSLSVYEDITFNPDNTSESLMISEDYTQVFISPNQTSPKIRTQDKETPFHILAKQSWKEGRHYWEVDVENCRTWSVGVVELASGNQLKTEAAGEHLGRDKSSWVLESEDGALAALHNDDFRAVKKRDVKRLGVYLDISKNKSRLTFYDVGGGVALHTFYALFKKEVFPAFSLSGTDGQVQSMALCNLRLMLDDTDSGLGSSRSSSTMSESGSSESSPEQWRNVVTTGPGAGYYDGP